MWKGLTADSILPYVLLGMTAVTGLVDAVSFLSLGHVFTANMTGNIVLLAFAGKELPIVLPHQRHPRMWDAEDQVVVADGQQFQLSLGQPLIACTGPAL